jgi:hypothetical protein
MAASCTGVGSVKFESSSARRSAAVSPSEEKSSKLRRRSHGEALPSTSGHRRGACGVESAPGGASGALARSTVPPRAPGSFGASTHSWRPQPAPGRPTAHLVWKVGGHVRLALLREPYLHCSAPFNGTRSANVYGAYLWFQRGPDSDPQGLEAHPPHASVFEGVDSPRGRSREADPGRTEVRCRNAVDMSNQCLHTSSLFAGVDAVG